MSKIAILVDSMFEDCELRIPFNRLREAGHDVDIVGLHAGAEVVGKQGRECVWIEKSVASVSEHAYDALVVPGGYSPDQLRMNEDAVRFTRAMALANKPIGAVCHAPWLLIEADLADDRVVTSWPSLRTDLLNAGARWTDQEVVVDGNIITSRTPDDVGAFSDVFLRVLADGVPDREIGERPSDEAGIEQSTMVH
ncbi:MAG TPA: type 1 glutamine amidotransferase domain-containing protein [Kofleriaceae bacterium]|nr:type 1 glutamine amidotransferase domain-containing protein [Kofleriaceae bacterium]